MNRLCVGLGVLGAVCVGLSAADEGVDDSHLAASGGLLTAPSFQPLDDATVYGSGPYTSVYVRGAVGVVFPFDVEVESTTIMGDDIELNSKVGIGYNTSVGLRLGPGPNPADPGVGYRFEAEFAQRFYDTDSLIDQDGTTLSDVDGDIEVSLIMGNILFDVSNEGYRGYLGFGAGVAMVDAEINGVSDDDTSFALQIPFGVEYRIVDNIWIDVGSRWVFIPGIDLDTDIEEMFILTADVYVGLLIEF